MANSSTCNQVVNVTTGQTPVVIIPADITVNNDPGMCGAVVTFSTSTSNNWIATIVSMPSSGSFFPLGVTSVTTTAIDSIGNTSSATFHITVIDAELPVANVSSLPVITGECSAAVTAPTAEDNCAGSVTGTTADSTSYSNQGTYTIHWLYNDGNGNTSTQNQIVIVQDVTAPSVNAPADISMCSAVPGVTISLGIPTGSDNCGTVSYSNNAPSAFQFGTTTVTWTADDGHGNTSTATQMVTVNPLPAIGSTVSPSALICAGASVILSGTGALTYTWSGGVTDGIPFIPAGTGSYTVTGTDVNGCTNTATQSVTVNANLIPGVTVTASADTVCSGTSVTFTAVPVNGGASPSYQWSVNGSNAGTNADTYITSTLADGDVVTCELTTSEACVTVPTSVSNAVTMTVTNLSVVPAGVASTAVNGQVCLGSNVTLSVIGGSLESGDSWQWYEGGCGSGASIGTGASIALIPSGNGAHQYFVRAEGGCGNTACESVTVDVISVPPAGTVHYSTSSNDGCVNAPAAVSSECCFQQFLPLDKCTDGSTVQRQSRSV